MSERESEVPEEGAKGQTGEPKVPASDTKAEAALRELSTWSLPRWEPDDPQTEGEQMRIFARHYFGGGSE